MFFTHWVLPSAGEAMCGRQLTGRALTSPRVMCPDCDYWKGVFLSAQEQLRRDMTSSTDLVPLRSGGCP